MKIEEEVRDVYGAIKPLPGGEDRMWIAIDRALDGKAKDVQIQLRPRRVKLRPFLTAAAVIVLLLMSLALLRSLRPRPENGELSVFLHRSKDIFPMPRNRQYLHHCPCRYHHEPVCVSSNTGQRMSEKVHRTKCRRNQIRQFSFRQERIFPTFRRLPPKRN